MAMASTPSIHPQKNPTVQSPGSTVCNANLALRKHYLDTCGAEGMSKANIAIREVTTLHIVRCAGDRVLYEMDVDTICGLLAQSRNLDTGESLSEERLRKIFNHAREMLEVAWQKSEERQRPIKWAYMHYVDLRELGLAQYRERLARRTAHGSAHPDADQDAFSTEPIRGDGQGHQRQAGAAQATHASRRSRRAGQGGVKPARKWPWPAQHDCRCLRWQKFCNWHVAMSATVCCYGVHRRVCVCSS